MVDNKDDGRRKWFVYDGVAGEDEISKKNKKKQGKNYIFNKKKINKL